jgi:hypothetical protein
VVIGLLIGGVIPMFVAALTMTAVGRAAGGMVDEVRRQFREIPGLMEGTARPDSARCVDISTKAALREMIAPGLVAVIAPVVVGYFSIEALGGLLAGATVTGVMMALFMANAGGAWDNAKKYIEQGAHGGKGSEAHKAAVVGDTVGDPFKDTSGPSMNILIKLMSVVALVLAPWFARIHGHAPAAATAGGGVSGHRRPFCLSGRHGGAWHPAVDYIEALTVDPILAGVVMRFPNPVRFLAVLPFVVMAACDSTPTGPENITVAVQANIERPGVQPAFVVTRTAQTLTVEGTFAARCLPTQLSGDRDA